jgi:hypothetical protein
MRYDLSDLAGIGRRIRNSNKDPILEEPFSQVYDLTRSFELRRKVHHSYLRFSSLIPCWSCKTAIEFELACLIEFRLHILKKNTSLIASMNIKCKGARRCTCNERKNCLRLICSL